MSRYQLTIEVDSLVELTRLARVLADAGVPAPVQAPATAAPTAGEAHAPAGAPLCPAGHGAMVARKGGTVTSGPRMGQAYPPFWACRLGREQCPETVEMRVIAGGA